MGRLIAIGHPSVCPALIACQAAVNDITVMHIEESLKVEERVKPLITDKMLASLPKELPTSRRNGRARKKKKEKLLRKFYRK